MKLQDIKGEYDTIFSLGDLCLAGIQLRENQIRPFAGVIDWMGSPRLKDVNRLLKNRFEGFMNFSHLTIHGYATPEILLVSDDVYQMYSNYDFYTNANTLTHLGAYDEVKAKYDRRVKRFLEKMETNTRTLFVRTEGVIDDVLETKEVLTSLVKNEFNLLVINHTNAAGLVEIDCPIERICMLEFPDVDKWVSNNHLWKEVLSGISITNR